MTILSISVQSFITHREGDIEDDIAYRIGAAWMKWGSASGAFCDKQLPLKLKDNFIRQTINSYVLGSRIIKNQETIHT